CYGVGCLILGMPGIGKSETALELVERGHRLVADDVVMLQRRREDTLYATATEVVEHHMEIRGVGLVDVGSIFGVGRVLNSKPISLVIDLEEWREDTHYDRTGLSENYVTLLGVSVPHLVIPVRPGRNIAIIVEVASLNHRLKELGHHTAMRFNNRLKQFMDNREP
ncbi:MAG TPA: HPr kinase/phosphorylase, partial [Candidatus Hydrogenedentes bacterium]|nr:HPr kinase/phosphorylase [Candidatus Hydrogenedentota bacterium]